MVPLVTAAVVACSDDPMSVPTAYGGDALPEARTGAAATWSGGEISWEQLDEATAQEARSLEIDYRMQVYELQLQAVEGLVVEQLLEAEASKRGLADIDALLAEALAGGPPPSEDAVDALWQEARAQYPGVMKEQLRPALVEELIRRGQADRYRELVGQLQEAAGVEYGVTYPDLPRVEVPVDPTDPSAGPTDAPVTIVQFLEYQCYFCSKVLPTLDQVMEEYEGKVRLVYKDFPLPGHDRALPAAIAARCAGEQGKYEPMSRLLLGRQQALEDADLLGYAAELSLDSDAFASCYGERRPEAAVMASLAQGRLAGVAATPTFLVNGVMLSGAQPYERFASIIDRELGRD